MAPILMPFADNKLAPISMMTSAGVSFLLMKIVSVQCLLQIYMTVYGFQLVQSLSMDLSQSFYGSESDACRPCEISRAVMPASFWEIHTGSRENLPDGEVSGHKPYSRFQIELSNFCCDEFRSPCS